MTESPATMNTTTHLPTLQAAQNLWDAFEADWNLIRRTFIHNHSITINDLETVHGLNAEPNIFTTARHTLTHLIDVGKDDSYKRKDQQNTF